MKTVSWAEWERQGFPGVKPGALVLSCLPYHGVMKLFGWGLDFFQSILSGRRVKFRHVMRYTGPGRVLSQESTYCRKSLGNFKGGIIRIWQNPAYSDEQRSRLVAQAGIFEGGAYDVLGIGGQALKVIPILGKFLARFVQVPSLNYCSERECETEKTETPDFGGGQGCQISPADVDDWCRRSGWECQTFKLVA